MTRSSMSILFVVFMTITVVFAIPPSALAKDKPDEIKAASVYSETVVVAEEGSDIEFDKTRAVTPYDYRAVILPLGGNAKCWTCGSPCGAYYCCASYPQCCLVNGRCMCCRF